jgi:hypothetical protein
MLYFLVIVHRKLIFIKILCLSFAMKKKYVFCCAINFSVLTPNLLLVSLPTTQISDLIREDIDAQSEYEIHFLFLKKPLPRSISFQLFAEIRMRNIYQ